MSINTVIKVVVKYYNSSFLHRHCEERSATKQSGNNKINQKNNNYSLIYGRF